jgi:hypothetical protein
MGATRSLAAWLSGLWGSRVEPQERPKGLLILWLNRPLPLLNERHPLLTFAYPMRELLLTPAFRLTRLTHLATSQWAG